MRRTNPMSILSTTPRRLLASFVVLIVVGVLAQLTILKASGLLSGTTSNSSNTYAASSCFVAVPSSMLGGPNRFSPASFTIAAGCSVKWTNLTSNNHNTRSTSNPVVWSSNNLGLNGTFTQPFPTAGTFPYRCSLHPSAMTGTITVT